MQRPDARRRPGPSARHRDQTTPRPTRPAGSRCQPPRRARRRAGPPSSARDSPTRRALDDVEEDRREEDAEEGHAQHAAEDGRPQRPPHLRPGPVASTSGTTPEDERERGHQDRPQPQPRCLLRRLEPRPSLLVQLAGELDDQDRVLARQPDQHDQADLHEDVDRRLARSSTPATEQSRHSGTTRITASGSDQLS